MWELSFFEGVMEISEILRDDFELIRIILSGVAPCLPEGGALDVSFLSSLKLTQKFF